MGMRSQIYVSFNNGTRDKNGVVTEPGKQELAAVYFGWNYGSRMVSRAAGLTDWLLRSLPYLNYEKDKIRRVAETNFDFKDVIDSLDIIAEANELSGDLELNRWEDFNDFIFRKECNNDGKLFISVGDDGTVGYCFTDCDCSAPMDAAQYMAWNGYQTEEDKGSNYSRNSRWLSQNAELMTADDLNEFLQTEYCNVGGGA